MKKSVIKRRKRVVPAALQSEHSFDGQQSQSPQAPSVSLDPHQQTHHNIGNTEAGRTNSDGSVNLEARQPDADGPGHRQILPEPSKFQSQQRGYHPPPVDFTGYAAAPLPTAQFQQQVSGASLPSISYPSPTQRHLSISPHPNSTGRKRSFSTSESETQDGISEHISDSGKSNRLSSIKSILNPAQQTSNDMPIEPSLLAGDNSVQSIPSKGSTAEGDGAAPHFANPNTGLGEGSGGGGAGGGNEDSRRRTTTEKRAELQREAEEIRQMLAAKER
ncbi:hypothetical protein GP486_002167, partial [Trichoglossum hirsutum]